MPAIQPVAVYVLWLREVKRLMRARSRIVGTLMMPLFFLAFLGSGFNRTSLPGVPHDIHYLNFLTPGIIGMSILFTSTVAGLSVLWDREFGFLKEIMVTPVSRLSIVLGRIAGGITTSLIQVVIILTVSLALGFRIRSAPLFVLALLLMILTSVTFIGTGLIFASMMRDMQGFNMVMSFVVFPLFFLSGALFPMKNFPPIIRIFSFLDPLTYGVDGLRATLIGYSDLPLLLDLTVISLFALATVGLGAYLFEKSESI